MADENVKLKSKYNMEVKKLKAKLLSRVERSPNYPFCWNRHHQLNNWKYSSISIDGQYFFAHRVSWELYNRKKITHGMEIAHLCHNPRCVNPGHLVMLTHAENMAMSAKNGTWRGENHPSAKITEAQAFEIKMLGMRSGLTSHEISDLTGVKKHIVDSILGGRNWKHIHVN